MNSHTGVKLGPVKMEGTSPTAFARSEASVVVLYHTDPAPLVSMSEKNGAIIGFPEIGNAVGE